MTEREEVEVVVNVADDDVVPQTRYATDAYDAMIRTYYTDEAVRTMAQWPLPFFTPRPPRPWFERTWRRVVRTARWPFARLAYLFAWLGGVDLGGEP